jgi:hypothetical protein
MNYVIMYILVDDLNQFCFQMSMKKQSLLLGDHVLLLGVHVLLPGVDEKTIYVISSESLLLLGVNERESVLLPCSSSVSRL